MPGKQYLDLSREKLPGRRIPQAHRLGPGSTSLSVEASRKNAGVIEYEQVIRPKHAGKVTKPAILKASRGSVYLQEAGSGPVGKGFLGYSIPGKRIVEF